MIVERRHVACLLVPLTVVVIRHDGDVVQVLIQGGHIVAGVNHLLGRGDCSGQKQIVGSEGFLQLSDPGSEAVLVAVFSLGTVDLKGLEH